MYVVIINIHLYCDSTCDKEAEEKINNLSLHNRTIDVEINIKTPSGIAKSGDTGV